jgi:peptidoglycan/LPS O-acetylase OafA/YrhL
VRFIAAFGVFLNHIASIPFTYGVVWGPLRNGDACVMIFFVLSGYIIAFVTLTRENSAKEYFVSRFSRMYSVVLIALALTYLLDISGMSINPHLYQIQKILWKPESWTGYISSLFFVNEFQIFQFGGISPGTNAPFWSLSFEVVYYVVFGLFIFTPWRIALPAAAFLLWMAGKTIVALMPVWFLGYALYQVRDRFRFPNWIAIVVFFSSAIFIALMPEVGYWLPSDNFGFTFPWGVMPFNRNLMFDYQVAIAFSLHLIAARQIFNSNMQSPERIERPIRWLGSITFPLYCIHYPALCFSRAISPWGPWTVLNFIFMAVAALLLAALLTPLCDNLKIILRNWLRSMLVSTKLVG